MCRPMFFSSGGLNVSIEKKPEESGLAPDTGNLTYRKINPLRHPKSLQAFPLRSRAG